MARSAPGVQRIVSILNFFADHPDQSFTLTDLVRALKLSRATCHALLGGLVEAGYLYRTSDKSYVIGPSLVSIGRIAVKHFSPLQVAQPEMRVLADEFDAICSAFFVDREDVVVRARAAAISQLGWSVPQGYRAKLRAPFAAVFYAWSPPAEAERWLAQMEPSVTPQQRAAMVEGMRFGREQGYLYSVRNLQSPLLLEAPERVFSGERSDFPVTLMPRLDTAQSYPLASVMAPVFAAPQQVAFTIGLMGFTTALAGNKVEVMGRRLRQACDRISDFIAGKPLA